MSTNWTIAVTAEPTLTDARTLYVPVALDAAKRPSRAVVWNWADQPHTQTVVKVVATRAGSDKAAAGTSLFEALGGSGAGEVSCGYRTAGTRDLLRFDPEARYDALIAGLGALLAALAAWLTMDKAATDAEGVRWVVSALVFLVGLAVTTLKLRKDLRDIGP